MDKINFSYKNQKKIKHFESDLHILRGCAEQYISRSIFVFISDINFHKTQYKMGDKAPEVSLDKLLYI